MTTNARWRAWRAGGSLAALVVLAGCATVQREARFAQVRDAVSQRLETNAVWNTSSEKDRAAEEAVERMLRSPLTSSTAVQIALLKNRRLQATYEELGIAQADFVEAGLLANPIFSATGLFAHNHGVEWDLDVVQDFVSVLSLSVRKKIGQAAADRAAYQVTQAALDLARDVQVQYYTVVGDAQTLELARQVVIATEAAADLAQRQHQAGNLSKRDQNIQQAFYAQTLLDVAQAETQLAVDRERLNRLLGLWGPQTRWTVSNRLANVPEVVPTAAELESMAISQRFDLAARKRDAQATKQALALARQFRYLNPLGVGVAFQRDREGTKSVGPTVSIGLPIFNQGQPTIARLESEYARSEHLVSALAVDIRSETREAAKLVAASRDTVRHYEKALLPLQQSIVSETLKFYNGMFVGAYDLLLAQQGQVQAGRQYIAALREFWISWTELERAVGGRLSARATVAPSEGMNESEPNAAKQGSDHGMQHQQPGDKPQ